MILLFFLAALYVPVLVNLIERRSGQEDAARYLSIYLVLGLLLDVGEGLWRGGQLRIATPRVANDFQLYGALALAFLLTLTVLSFTRREKRVWLILGGVWVLGLIIILPNLLGSGDVIWTNGRFALTLERLAP
ncbi:MAG TPA: hypothetical protein VKE92_16400, partial [Anaerolineales bacterium]|nr:hypothetical protein [Anaerolineales bacterium]